ncbi:Dabb family protein [Mycetocola sp. 2940]|uniref:Dabb family protein n=1 Tax=Mycetocola sp. 2940 TaxID=3156452 RepID=UPI0033981920
MITHIGMLTFAPTATDADRQAIADGLAAMLGQIDGLTSVAVAQDAGLKDGNAGLIFQLSFDSEDAWRNYGAHPAHQKLVAERIAPVIVAKSFLQTTGFAEVSL